MRRPLIITPISAAMTASIIVLGRSDPHRFPFWTNRLAFGCMYERQPGEPLSAQQATFASADYFVIVVAVIDGLVGIVDVMQLT